MKSFLLTAVISLAAFLSNAQFTYKIKADSVKITNDSCTAELILENSTKNINGFLYNRGIGRTEFRQPIININGTSYPIGPDTLYLDSICCQLGWKITGNSGITAANFLGTIDSAKLAIRTKNIQRMSVFENGTVNIASTDATTTPLFRFYPNGDFTANADNRYINNQYTKTNGIRFNKKLGILEIGLGNNIDTTRIAYGNDSAKLAALIVNSNNSNTINGPIVSSIIVGNNMLIDSAGGMLAAILVGSATTIDSGAFVYATPVIGESHLIKGNLFKTFLNGFGHKIYSTDCREGFITGTSHQVRYRANSNLVTGFVNIDLDSNFSNIVGGSFNTYSGNSNLISGYGLVSQGWASTTLGAGNTSFSSLPTVKAFQPDSLMKYPLLILGNSTSYNTVRSNALTVLYSGRTQINTTGHTTTLSQSDVTPKAALDVVSTNSGVLLPRLTNTQRGNIISGDLHNGLLLYNTDATKFQYYDGSTWRTITDDNTTITKSQIENIASGTVLGNNTASAAAPIEVKTWMVLNTYSISNAATADFDLSNYYTVYDELKLTCHDIRPATNNASMYVRISSDGSTYAASGGNYQYQIDFSLGSSAGGLESTSAAQILIGNNISNSSSVMNLFDMVIRKPGQSTLQPAYRIDYDYKSSTGSSIATTKTLGYRLNAQVTRGVRLLASTGNIYCNCVLSGLKY